MNTLSMELQSRFDYEDSHRYNDIRTLNRRFKEATRSFGYKNMRGTDLYEYQVEFAYKIHNLKTAPSFIYDTLLKNLYAFINSIDKVK